jgi:formylglycine-generating enzyme required for sulfatase activity
MLRGGSWADDRSYAKISAREFANPATRNQRFGFRLVCSLSPAP